MIDTLDSVRTIAKADSKIRGTHVICMAMFTWEGQSSTHIEGIVVRTGLWWYAPYCSSSLVV